MKSFESSFNYTLHYKNRRRIELEVGYRFYPGRTPSMGDEPDEVEIVYCLDSLGRDVFDKLPEAVIPPLRSSALEHGRERSYGL